MERLLQIASVTTEVVMSRIMFCFKFQLWDLQKRLEGGVV